MTNKLSDYQKEVFMDIYKTSLGTNQFPNSISINAAISDSATIAFASVELLTDGNEFRNPSDIIKMLNDRRSDEPIEFPQIEELRYGTIRQFFIWRNRLRYIRGFKISSFA